MLFASGISLFAQKASVSAAEDFLSSGNIIGAISEYEKLIAAEPENPDFLLNLGYCYLKLPEYRAKSINVLEKSYEIYKNDNSNKQLLDAGFLLGIAYRQNFMFDSSVQIFNHLIIDKEFDDYKSVDIIQREIDYTLNAKKFHNSIELMKISQFNSEINTEFTEHSPVFVENLTKIIFTSRKPVDKNSFIAYDGQPVEHIYIADYADGKISKPELFFNLGKDDDSFSNSWVDKNMNSMFVHLNGDIFLTKKNENGWSKPEAIKNINSSYFEVEAFFNAEQTEIFFSSDRPGGYGGTDIYKISKKGNKWSKPINLGPIINTEFNEKGLFVNTAGTLFFSSTGHNSMGGYDIFSAQSIGNSEFASPKNLGVPINSVSNDIFFNLSDDNSIGLLASDRESSNGSTDIYFVDYNDSTLHHLLVKGVAQKQNSDSKNIKVKVFRINDKEKIVEFELDSTGNYMFSVSKGTNYYVEISADDYFPEAFTISAPIDDSFDKILSKIILTKYIPENVNKQYSLSYSNNNTAVNNVTELFLNTITSFLNSHSDLLADMSCSDSLNIEKTNLRIQNIIDFFAQKGISDDKISANLMSSKLKGNNVLLTLLDKRAKQNAFYAKINENNSNSAVNSGNGTNANYTVQIGAFEKRKTVNNKMFRALQLNVREIKCKDNLWHYIYGNYQYKSETENVVIQLQRKGFTDSFARELKWYDENKK